MKPTEPNKPLDTELIAHVRERLLEHEETYVPGAWEKFNAQEKKKRPLIWLQFLSGAAAILIIGLGIFLLNNNKTTENTVAIAQTKIAPKNQESNLNNSLKNDSIKHKSENSFKQNELKIASKNELAFSPIENKVNDEKPVIVKQINEKEVVAFQNQTTTDNQIITPKNVIIPDKEKLGQKEEQVVANNNLQQNKPNIISFLEGETKKNQTKKTDDLIAKKGSKFTLGLVVAPSFGNVKKLNMGYGVSLDYALSDKFSLNSGIAYNQMAGKNVPVMEYAMNSPNSPTTNAIISKTSTKSLESVEEKISGIDIPLEIKYNFSKHIYANVGVSAFAVINQKRNNIFIENRVEQRLQSSTNGSQQYNSVLVTDRLTEEVAPTKAEDYSYLGFYNFSFGYKKKISKNNAFAIEPFVKLPMKQVNTENLKLIGTGVKLKFDF